MIAHLKHNEIDKAAWDARLMRCAQPFWYAQSWVLSRASPGWEALIDDEADAMMPLCRNRKWGIDYLYQPLGLQQLGVFAAMPSPESHAAFIAAAINHFRYIDIWLHEGMERTQAIGATLETWPNQILIADAPIDSMREHYAKGHRRNLKQGDPSMRSGTMDAASFIALFRRTTGARFGASAVKGLDRFEAVITEGLARKQCRIDALYHEGEAIAAACFAEWQGRSTLLKSANTNEGQERKAMFLLIDAWIERHAGSGTILDFAGSATESVARFNRGFGATDRAYFRLRANRLPIPLRWLKR